jgi:flagellar biosynthesis protein FlhG
MNLDADYILLDLGAGSHYNTIDSFLIADKMVVVVTPEKISIENMYHFIKNSLIRNIEKIYSFHNKKYEFTQIFKNRSQLGINNLKELIDYLILNTDTGERLAADIREFKLCIVINKVRNIKNVHSGFSIQSVLNKYLGIETNFIGFVEYDDQVSMSTNRNEILVIDYPGLRLVKEIKQLSENLIQNKQLKLRL